MKPIDAKTVGNYLLYGLTVTGAVVFYLWLQRAPLDQPKLFLHPVTWMTSLFSGVSFILEPEIGYWGMTASGNRILIEKACSGSNFFLLCFTMLIFTLLRNFGSTAARLLVFAGGLAVSYLTAIVASSFRIISTILLLDARLGMSPVLLHNVIGIVTYVAFICLCYIAAYKLVSHLQNKRSVNENGK